MVSWEDNLRKKKKIRRRRLLKGIVFLLVVFLCGINSIITISQQKKQILDLEQGIEKIKQENDELMKEIKRLKTDPSLIEYLARQIGMMRPGEKKVRFMKETETETNLEQNIKR